MKKSIFCVLVIIGVLFTCNVAQKEMTVSASAQTIIMESALSVISYIYKQCSKEEGNCFQYVQDAIGGYFWSKDSDGKIQKNENYLAILDINSFKSILENGWYVLINTAAGFKDINDLKNSLDNQNLKTFSLVGKFNVGKSFIIKLLSEVFVKTGDTLHTIGIEFYKAKGDILFLDVAGEKNPVRDEPGYILDRRLIDYFVEEVVQETSMSHIHVVNRIDNTDQEKLMKLRARANEIKAFKNMDFAPPVYVIHNLRGIKTLEDAKIAIKRDIEDVFIDAEQRYDHGTEAVYYQSQGMFHYIFAEHETDAGYFYNENTKNLLLSNIQNKGFDGMSTKGFFTKLIKNMEQKLKQFLVHKDKDIVMQTGGFYQKLHKKLSGVFSYFEQTQATHEQPQGKLIILPNNTEKNEFNRIILENADTMKIHDQIFEINGHLQINYGNQFVPIIQTYQILDQYYFEAEMMDSIETTQYRIYASKLVLKGERKCEPVRQIQENIIMKPAKKCGKFLVEKFAPKGYNFQFNNAYLDLKSHLSSLNGQCINGVCSFILQLFENEETSQKEDL